MTRGVILPAIRTPDAEQFLADTGGTGVPGGWSMSAWVKHEPQQPGGDRGRRARKRMGYQPFALWGPWGAGKKPAKARSCASRITETGCIYVLILEVRV